jgi:hypothetical protein
LLTCLNASMSRQRISMRFVWTGGGMTPGYR